MGRRSSSTPRLTPAMTDEITSAASQALRRPQRVLPSRASSPGRQRWLRRMRQRRVTRHWVSTSAAASTRTHAEWPASAKRYYATSRRTSRWDERDAGRRNCSEKLERARRLRAAALSRLVARAVATETRPSRCLQAEPCALLPTPTEAAVRSRHERRPCGNRCRCRRWLSNV
jgi:hypothetical protein